MLTLALALLLQDDLRKEWEGFTEGSSVTVRITESDGAKQESIVQRYQIAKNEAESVLVRLEQGGRTKDQSIATKKDAGFKKLGTENVDIDGRTFTCAVWEKVTESGKTRRTVKQWMHKDVPGRVAKIEMVTKADVGELRASGKVTKLDQRLQVNGKAVTYAVYEFSGRTDDGREATAVRWVSEQVPGFTVREETRTSREGSAKQVSRVTELIDFELK